MYRSFSVPRTNVRGPVYTANERCRTRRRHTCAFAGNSRCTVWRTRLRAAGMYIVFRRRRRRPSSTICAAIAEDRFRKIPPGVAPFFRGRGHFDAFVARNSAERRPSAQHGARETRVIAICSTKQKRKKKRLQKVTRTTRNQFGVRVIYLFVSSSESVVLFCFSNSPRTRRIGLRRDARNFSLETVQRCATAGWSFTTRISIFVRFYITPRDLRDIFPRQITLSFFFFFCQTREIGDRNIWNDKNRVGRWRKRPDLMKYERHHKRFYLSHCLVDSQIPSTHDSYEWYGTVSDGHEKIRSGERTTTKETFQRIWHFICVWSFNRWRFQHATSLSENGSGKC